MLRVRKVLLDRHKAFEEAIQMNGSVEFWKEELLAEKGKGDQVGSSFGLGLLTTRC